MADHARARCDPGDLVTPALSPDREPQFGLIVLQADETLERDMVRLMPEQASCLVSRVPSAEDLTRDSLRAMEAHLTAAAALLPRGAVFRGVAYGCTSGTAEIGAARIDALVRAGVDTPAVTQPVSALVAACAHLGVSKLGLVSPYVANVSDRLKIVLHEAGIETPKTLSFDEPREENVARIEGSTLTAAATDVGRGGDCDAVFLSCTNLRTLDVIDRIEDDIGKPVLSSNQVLAWHLCQIAGVPANPKAPGLLFANG